MVHALAKRAETTPDDIALVACDGTQYTWAQYDNDSSAFARSLLELGEKQGIAVHAFNEPRWFFAALGALKAGWTVSGIYTTNTYEQAAHIIQDERRPRVGAGVDEATYDDVRDGIQRLSGSQSCAAGRFTNVESSTSSGL